jgi:hypothetical protein
MHSTIVKKTIFIILAIAITGCSAIPLDLSFLNTPTSAPTNSPQPTVTLIRATNTPDLFSISTAEPTNTPNPETPIVLPSRTTTYTPTFRPTITLEPLDPFLFTPSPPIFASAQRSTNQLIWGYNCDGSRSVRFTVQAAFVKRMKYVLLFYRLQDKYSGRGTEWGGGAIMKDNDKGTYFYTLEVDQIEDYRSFQNAWLQYQFVASTIGLTVLGRSVVDRTSISLTHCSVLNR